MPSRHPDTPSTSRSRVFLTRRLPEAIIAEWSKSPVELVVGPEGATIPRERLREELATADAVVTMLNDPIDDALLAEAPRLRIVANYAAGFNNVDLDAAARRGIWVTNTPDATTEATADVAFGLLIAAARQFAVSERSLREGTFVGWSPTAYLGPVLSGATLGIVGLGRIGQAVARRAAGFGMRVLTTSRTQRQLPPSLEVERCSLEELLGRSDFVSLHCPLTEQTRHLIDERALAMMKPTAVLVNTSRGPVIDEAALAEALHRGHLAGAGLDVYEREPVVHPRLLTAPRTVLLPHVGTSSLHARRLMAAKVWGDVLRVLSGEPPLHPVNRPTSREEVPRGSAS